MVESSSVPRVVLAIVTPGRSSVPDDMSKLVIDELHAATVKFIRILTVTREKRFIEQLIYNIATSNEADAIILIGGSGLGPRDYTCETVDALVDRRIDGFGEEFRRLLREDLAYGARSLLQRATAGVYNKCVIFALPRQPEPVRLALRLLVLPTVAEAVRVAAQ